MNVLFSDEERLLITLLKYALQKKHRMGEEEYGRINNIVLWDMAKKHAILPLLYDMINENNLYSEYPAYVEWESKRIVLQSYRLLFLTNFVVELLRSSGIEAVVLKGVATASFYPIPELRKSGDVDLLILGEIDEDKLVTVMTDAGFSVSKDQHANHHIVFVSQEGICIELHGMLAEPFTYKKINQAMEKQMRQCREHIQLADVMGVKFPILDKPYHAYELLLHMLQHFMYAGFGLKLLCDWVMIWHQDWSDIERELFAELVKESGLERFAEVLTAICIKYLGLEQNAFAWVVTISDMEEDVLREILDSEEFGNSDNNRMVMMNGTGFGAYIREFQHQMYLNFPKLSKCFLLWPVLWVITLVRFLRNNKRVRNTSAREVLNEAKRRSELMKQLKLFQ